MLTSSNVGLAGAKGVIAATFTSTLIRVMQTQQAIFSTMQRFAGVLMWWQELLLHAILKRLVKSWQRQSFTMVLS
jgi:hypothetical protein